MATELATRAIPAIKEPPLIGSLRDIQKNRLGLYQKMAALGDISLAHFGPFPGVFINSPEMVHELLVEKAHDFDKGYSQRRAFTILTGDGLLVKEGTDHQKRRKLMAPAFAYRRVAHYAEVMAEYTERLAQKLQDGALINLDKEITALTMSIVSKALFDAEISEEADELGEAIVIGGKQVEHFLVHLFPIPTAIPTPRNRKAKKAVEIVQQRVQAIIDERRRSGEDKGDFLSMLLEVQDENGQKLSDEDVRDEAMTLFLAGHETTATALAWTFYLLMQHPEIYGRLQQELDSVLQGRTLNFADLEKLPYAMQVFKETMRLYPPASALLRYALRDTTLGGYPLAKNTTVFLSPYTMHRRPDFYPQPEKFDPERFSPENEKKLPRYAYMPFGGGARICIGNHFALMEGQIILATLAQHTTFELAPGQNIQAIPTITLRPQPGVKAIVHKR